ncbi:hypothetical protein TA3x_005117 [Tundrisphaera sp. TA3]|uniref:hypothetical protein n=1 Tax=Tundrisphaera sp. TA3 TaxID=3435775 RepID=UPI003EC064C2
MSTDPIRRIIRYLDPLEASTTIEADGDRLDVTIQSDQFTLRTNLDIETAERIRDALAEVIAAIRDGRED